MRGFILVARRRKEVGVELKLENTHHPCDVYANPKGLIATGDMPRSHLQFEAINDVYRS